MHYAPALWVSLPSAHDHSAGHDRSGSSDAERSGLCQCGRADEETTDLIFSSVSTGAWKSDVTVLTSQPCCLGKACESGTSGEEQKCFVTIMEAEISGG